VRHDRFGNHDRGVEIIHDVVKAHQIDVTTKDGIVTLTGNVDSESAKQKAIDLARSTKGVKNVVDMISAQNARETATPRSESTIGETVTDTGIHEREDQAPEDELAGWKRDRRRYAKVSYLTGKVRSAAEKEKAIHSPRTRTA
jgi:osmotically-inducible protein OsmY